MLDDLSSSRVFKIPEFLFDAHKMHLDSLQNGLSNNFNNIILKNKSSFKEKVAKLNALNPMSVLSRGYSVSYNANNDAIKSVDQIEINDIVTIKFIDGKIEANVISKMKEKRNG